MQKAARRLMTFMSVEEFAQPFMPYPVGDIERLG
jgi:hypothetical protein